MSFKKKKKIYVRHHITIFQEYLILFREENSFLPCSLTALEDLSTTSFIRHLEA